MMAYRVVIADDDLPLLRLLHLRLEAGGRFTVVGEARDGNEAVALVASCDPDLLVLDLSMPKLDGLEVLERLADRRPVVAVLTGLEDPDLEARSYTAGAAAYLQKGSAFDDLPEVLAGLLDRQRRAAAV